MISMASSTASLDGTSDNLHNKVKNDQNAHDQKYDDEDFFSEKSTGQNGVASVDSVEEEIKDKVVPVKRKSSVNFAMDPAEVFEYNDKTTPESRVDADANDDDSIRHDYDQINRDFGVAKTGKPVSFSAVDTLSSHDVAHPSDNMNETKPPRQASGPGMPRRLISSTKLAEARSSEKQQASPPDVKPRSPTSRNGKQSCSGLRRESLLRDESLIAPRDADDVRHYYIPCGCLVGTCYFS